MADQSTPFVRKVNNGDNFLAAVDEFADIDSGKDGDSSRDDMSLASTVSFNPIDIKVGPENSPELDSLGPRDPSHDGEEVFAPWVSPDNSEFDDIMEEKEKNELPDSDNDDNSGENNNDNGTTSDLGEDEALRARTSDESDELYDPNDSIGNFSDMLD